MTLLDKFYLAPKSLFQGKFEYLSCDAKILYIYLFQKMRESNEQGLVDSNDNLYVEMTHAQVEKVINAYYRKTANVLKEMVEYGVLEIVPLKKNTIMRLYIANLC